MTDLIKPRLLDTKQAAFYLCKSESTLKQARMTGKLDGEAKAPLFTKEGRSVRYAIEDLDNYVNSLPRFSSLAEASAYNSKV